MQAEVVRQVLSLAHQAVKETHRDRIESYIRAYCRAIPPEVFEDVEAHRLLAFVMDRFAFLEEDFGRTVKVAISDPETTLLSEDIASTVIETRLPDAKFIIRTIKTFLRQQGLHLHFVLHPIHGVIHDHGHITGIDASRGTKYSQVYLQVSAIPAEKREALRRDLEARLELLLLVNRDRFDMVGRFNEVRALVCAVAGRDPASPSPRESQSIPRDIVARAQSDTPRAQREIDADEAVELMDWFKDDNFVFLGYAWFPQGGNGSRAAERGLGLFAAPERKNLEEVVGEIVATRRTRDEVYSFYRTDYMSVVRSVAQVRYFGVAQSGPDGKTLGEHVFIGLMSTKALKQANRRVPVVGKRIKEVMSKLEEQPGSYAYTKSVGILDSLPLEDLFYWNIDELRNIVEQFRIAEAKDHARAFVWRRRGGRRITVVCVVPRMQFSEAQREELSQEIRKFLQVPHLREYRQETDDESPVRLHFTVGKYRSGVTDAELEKLGEELEHLLESWDDQLRGLVFKRYRGRAGEHTGNTARYLATTASAQEIWARYGVRFPDSYKGTLSPEVALLDITHMEKLDDSEGLRVALVPVGEGTARHTSLRIVSRKELLLNDVVPSLHRMALRTTSRLAERLEPVASLPDVYITGFEVTGADGRKFEDEPTLERLGAIIQRVLVGQLLDDRLLGLGYLAGLDYKQIDLLITYRNYFVQVFQGFGAQAVDETLLRHPHFATLLVEYFETKFATDRKESVAERAEKLLPAIARKYDELLERVTVIQEDLILRYFIDLFEATRRTNYYRPGRGDAISIKIESALVEHMPRPCPLYEIYVHAPGVEGIHLRGGKVARGGLRHSDRPDDFRTEVLGLQRTQALKNVIIVPQGAKGGFVTRKLSPTRDEARAQYEVFIAGLLDVTDNYSGTSITPPPGVLRYDEDDPYLVVAADKGTAHLSDTANAISQRYKFWLDDAFASGGSAGYDHKAMGITSRGGWTNVERHFREMGTDIRKTSIRVAGVGDMAGDVFGNGMLLNEQLRLVAAFNHKHVFIDPEPDPAKSYAERKRLFTTPGTQWSDYRPEVLSKGGGVYERAAKEIALSPEARKLLGLEAKVVTGPDIVRAILMLEVDLMWFGGIGTYVKASTESHGEVGDKVNDHVRINAIDLHAKVIGEGANLAITQRGRTEYGLHGGRHNTDAIDNSAGVDCSDHEVNLKILLAPLAASGKLNREARDKLLRELEPDVGAACVQDNYLQSALLSMEAARARKHGEVFLDVLSYLDKHGLSRLAEHIPPDEELRGWLSSGKGLPRNLLAVLVAHTKNDLYERVLTSRIPDLPLFQPYLSAYFPPAAAAKFPEQVAKHHLRREIIATVVTNAIINQAGCTLLVQLCKETNAPLDELVVRYFMIDELLGGQKLRAAIHAGDGKIAAADQYAALMALEEVHRSLLRWWIWNEATWRFAPEDVSKTKPQLEAAAAALVTTLDGVARVAYEVREQDLVQRGFSAEVAATLARGPLLREAFALLANVRDGKVKLDKAAAAFHRAGRELNVDAFDEILATQIPANSWERRFFASLEREASAVRQQAAARLAAGPELIERNRERIDRIGDALGTVKQLGAHGLVPLFLILEDYRAVT